MARSAHRAARVLWRGHSRRHAREVLAYLAAQKDGDRSLAEVRKEVEADLRPEAIRAEIEKGDYRWGSWLAFLRPNKECVPALLEGLKGKPEWLAETTLALGGPRDPRALEALLALLKKGEYRSGGFTAQALVS